MAVGWEPIEDNTMKLLVLGVLHAALSPKSRKCVGIMEIMELKPVFLK